MLAAKIDELQRKLTHEIELSTARLNLIGTFSAEKKKLGDRISELAAEVGPLVQANEILKAENARMEKEIYGLNNRVSELRETAGRQKEPIRTLEKRTVQLVNDTFILNDRIGELERSVNAKATTIRKLCWILVEAKP